VVLPVTAKLDRVPTDVMLGCAAVVTVPAVVALVAVPADPLTDPVIVAVTVNALNVPTEVMLGCAAVVTVPAVVAEVALGTVPVTFAPVSELRPAPEPKCVAITFPEVTLPVTLKLLSVPTLVILG
jgi:hypothetical protein